MKPMWKAMPDHVLTVMASCLRLGYFPEEWKAAPGVVLLKSPDTGLGVFVDFKGAFDNLEWSAIIQRLQHIGCKEMALWRNYFSGRKSRATSSAGVVEVVVRRGVPKVLL